MAQRSRDYIVEKLAVALDCLAASDAPLKDRLLNAYISSFMRLMESDFSEGSEIESFKFISDFFATVQDEKRGSAAASIDAASIEQCKDVASKMVWMLFTVANDGRN